MVGRQAEVAFDAGAKLQRGSKSGETIFKEGVTMMKSAMREAVAPRIERISS